VCLLVCVCVRACVRAYVHACIRACVRACVSSDSVRACESDIYIQVKDMQTRLTYEGPHNCTVVSKRQLRVSEGVVLCSDVVSTSRAPEPWALPTVLQGVASNPYSVTQILCLRVESLSLRFIN